MINFLKRIYRSFPYKDVIDLTECLKLPTTRYIGGVAKTKIGELTYGDSLTLLAGLKELFIEKIYKVKKWSNSNPIVLDCGANIGLSALFFANTYNAKVYAVEADPNIFKSLTKNAAAKKGGEIHPINKAVWIDADGVTFDIEGGYSGQIHQHGSDLVKGSVQIPSLRLRDMILEFDKVDLLKLDIEGAENSVIPDCEGVLNRIDYIFIEYHSNGRDPQYFGEILNILKKEGFRYHVKEAFTSSHPFDKINEMAGMDLQLNVYAINKNIKS